MKTISVEDFTKQAIELYGEKRRNWKFKCPRCGTVQSGQDFLDADIKPDVAEGFIGFSCIGRVVNGKGCDWTLGGLFLLHKLEIVDDAGKKHPHFELAQPESATIK